MQKIISGKEVSIVDATHVALSGQSSYGLMESAAGEFIGWMKRQQFEKKAFLVVVGKGNNGGDGLAIARMLHSTGYNVSVLKCFGTNDKLSPDAHTNLKLLPEAIPVYTIKDSFPTTGILVDAFLGVGLKGELREDAAYVIERINKFNGYKISIDIPSGLPSDGLLKGLAVKADVTVSFEFPKLSLLLPEHVMYVGDLVVLKIGIKDDAYHQVESAKYYLTAADIPAFHRKFNRFSHKGDFGKILLAGGSPGKMGALILCAKSALRTGSGLVSCHMEETEHHIMQTAIPEAMATWGLIPNAEYYDALGIGPGWGQENRLSLMRQLLHDFNKPMVIDADGLNLLAKNKELLGLIPKNSILTPHIGEFTRLAGECDNHLERLEKAKKFAVDNEVILILKGANSVVNFPDERQVFNSSGTQFMATGGSGDVLTGMLTSFLGMGYSAEHAALCGVYHHGLAGEIAAQKRRRGVIASDIIEAIPETFIFLDIF